MSLLKIIDSEYLHLSLWNFAFFIFGIVGYFSLEYEPSIDYVIALFGGSFATLFLRKYGSWGILISGIFIAFTFGMLVSKIRQEQIHTIALEDEVTTNVSGTVSALKHTPRGIQATIDKVHFNTLLLQDKDPDKVRISIPLDDAKNILVGDKISVFASLSPPSRSILPGGYDFGLYAYFSGVGATGFALGKVTNYSNEDKEDQPILHKIRKHIYFRLIEIMGKNNGNFAAALLLGESGGLDRTIMQNMRYSGLAHVLCVSGLHLSLVAGIFFLAARVLMNLSNFIAWHSNIKITAAVISLLGSGIYLMLSGVQIAATRAYIMTSIFMISVILSRVPYPMRSLGIAATFMLILNPEYVLHPSFQLSFAAVLALIGGYEFYIRNKWILGESSGFISNIKMGIFSNIYSSLLAGLSTTPIVIYHFYTVSNYTALANLLVVPLVSFIVMPLGVISMFLLPLGLDHYTLLLMGEFIGIIINIADWVTNLPGSIWNFGYITAESLCVYMFGLFWLMLWNTKFRLYGLIIISISLWMMCNSPKPDVIFDAKMQILGIKDADGKLEIHASKISHFTKTYWNNWFGQKEDLFYKENITDHDHHILTQSGRGINILFKDIDYEGNMSIRADEWVDKGALLIFCNKEKCSLKYEDKKRFVPKS